MPAQLRARRFDPSQWGLVRHSADGHRIAFGLAGPSPESRPRMFGWFTLAGLLLLTALAYAYVRHLLRPLEAIGEGVARFGCGEFGTPIVTAHRQSAVNVAVSPKPSAPAQKADAAMARSRARRFFMGN